MGATNTILQATNQVPDVTGLHAFMVFSGWPIILWISAVITSSVAGVLLNQFIERRKNRVRFFKMEKVDFETIHAGPALHRGKNYNSVRCATYRLKNSSNMDYREVVLHIGFRAGEIIHVLPHSDLMGSDHFKIDFSRLNQTTITFPVFNRGDVIDLRVEAANCQDIEIIWKYVGSHTGVQIGFPPLQASPGGATSPKVTAGSPGRLEVQKTSSLQRFRTWLAEKIHPGLGLL